MDKLIFFIFCIFSFFTNAQITVLEKHIKGDTIVVQSDSAVLMDFDTYVAIKFESSSKDSVEVRYKNYRFYIDSIMQVNYEEIQKLKFQHSQKIDSLTKEYVKKEKRKKRKDKWKKTGETIFKWFERLGLITAGYLAGKHL